MITETGIIELDVDHVGSQDPADQPTAAELEALSQYFREQKQRRAAEAVRQQAETKLQEAGQAV